MRVLLLALALAVPAPATRRSPCRCPTTASARSCASSSACSRPPIPAPFRRSSCPTPRPAKSFSTNGFNRVLPEPSSRSGCAAESPNLPKGEGFDVYVDALAEFGRNGRVGTWLIRVRRNSPAADTWRIAGFAVLTTVRGLYRLTLSPGKQYTVSNLALSAEDFEMRVPNGSAFVAETDAGVTGIVIMGRGEMTFSPTPAPEKGQVRIYSGGDSLNSRFDWVYLRAHPAEFDQAARRDHVSRARCRSPRFTACGGYLSGKSPQIVRHRAGRLEPRPMVGDPEVRRSRRRDGCRPRAPHLHEVG